MSSHNDSKRHLTHDQIDALVQKNHLGGRCPICGRVVHPARVTDIFCMCDPQKIRDVLMNMLANMCNELGGR